MTSQRTTKPRLNEQIRARTLRVIDADGTSLGIIDREVALARAAELDLDLVEVSATSDPPVAKILDYGREQFRAEREAKKHRKTDPAHEIKEIQLRPTTDEHDLATKAKATSKFLNRGNRVRVVVVLRGRLQHRPEMADATLERFYALITEEFVTEHHSRNGTRISVMLRGEAKPGGASVHD